MMEALLRTLTLPVGHVGGYAVKSGAGAAEQKEAPDVRGFCFTEL